MVVSHWHGVSKTCTFGFLLYSRYSIIIVLFVAFVMVFTINGIVYSVLMRKEPSMLTNIFLRYSTNMTFLRDSTNHSIISATKNENVARHKIGIPEKKSKESDVGHCLNIPYSSELTIPKGELLIEMSIEDLSCLLQRFLTTLQTFCSEPRRVGNVSYGGVNICMEQGVTPRKGCIIYSYDHDLSARFINQMKAHFKCTTIFFGKAISTNFFRDVGGFNKILENHGDEASILILKMESRDFKPFLKFPRIIDKFSVKQIILEIYYDEEYGNRTEFFDILSALRSLLDINYYIYWFDGNQSCDDRVLVNNTSATCLTVNMMRHFKSSSNVHLQKINLPDHILPLGGKHVAKPKLLKYQYMYLNYISKHQILCKQRVRLGIEQDGNSEVCHDVSFRPRSPCIVYSFVRSFDLSFFDDIDTTYWCDVFVFNPSIELKNYNISRRIKFHSFGIGERNAFTELDNKTEETKTLKTIQDDLGHSKRRIDFLKIDIGDVEKEALSEMVASGTLGNVAQISATFRHYHDIGTLRKLHEIGFRIFQTRQNPKAEFFFKNRSYSYINDVHFVNINITK